MSPFLVFVTLCLKFWTSVQGNLYESGEVVFQNVLRWNYTYMNPQCLDATGGRNPCQDVRICRLATASLALGGWPTLCGWVGKGVPKVCCGLPLVLGPGLMKKVEEEISRKMQCGTRIRSSSLSETTDAFFRILDSLPEIDISDPDKFDPPLDLETKPILIPPFEYTGSRQGDFRWMVSVRRNGTHICGGSLIDRKHVLTSARCVLGKTNEYAVHVGNLFVDDGFAFQVAKISVHPQYQIGNSKNLGILTLSEEILSPYVPNICLPESSEIEENLQEFATLLRWGKRTSNGTNKQILRIIDGLVIIPMEECQKVYASEILPEELEDFICAKRNQSDTFPCQEDYGGPVMQQDSEIDPTAPWTIIGVDTFGSMCENSKNLRIYTKVSRHLNWILDTTNNKFFTTLRQFPLE